MKSKFKKLSSRQNKLSLAFFLFIIVGFSSCFLHFYKTNTADHTDAAILQDLMTQRKYFILHANEQGFLLTNLKVNGDMLEAVVDNLPVAHLPYLHPKNEHANRFPKSDRGVVPYEVHLYTNKAAAAKSQINIPVKDFYRVDVYELDKGAITRSRVLSIVGISVATAGLFAIIAAATISSFDDYTFTTNTSSNSNENAYCSPQVYALNGSERQLTGIFYSGAIFAPLERTDYLPLAGIDPVNSKFHLQLRCGEKEEQIIHDTKLLQVTHQKDDNVLPDGNGKLLVYRQPVKPDSATTGPGTDIRNDVSGKDAKWYSFTNHTPGQNSSDLILNFQKPVGVSSGKLVITAKNSPWAVYLFKKFKSLYGDYYTTLLQQKDKADRKKLIQCELDQSLPLSVSVKQGNTWKYVDYFYTPGNGVLRDMIMEIDLAGFKNSDHVQVKLETTFMFWELDYVGMDFSENLPFEKKLMPAERIAKWDSASQITLFNPAATNVHITDKEHVDIDFSVKPATGSNLINSYFLVGSGYYHDKTHYKGKPQWSKLARFSHKGAFDKFSRQTFEELLSEVRNNGAREVADNN